MARGCCLDLCCKCITGHLHHPQICFPSSYWSNSTLTMRRTLKLSYPTTNMKLVAKRYYEYMCIQTNKFIRKKTLWPFFMNGVQLLQRLHSHFKKTVYFLPLSAQTKSTHLIKIRRIKSLRVDLGATWWFSKRNPGTGNPAS